jgi:hypothetical protein
VPPDRATSERPARDEPHRHGLRSAPELSSAESTETLADELDRIAFQPLHQVVLHMAGTIGIVEPAAASRLRQDIAEIDDVIAGLRATLTAGSSRRAPN